MDKLTISITPSFDGFVVLANVGPTKDDPLAQRQPREVHPTLEEAVGALPRVATVALARRGAE